MSLRIGQITYLNVVPFFHYLRDAGFSGEIVCGVPAELNQMLANGEIDACPSSSYEYGLHADQYLLLPGLSISSIGPVQSVLLFCHQELGSLNGAEIAITGESATSVNLLKVLLQEFCGVKHFACEIPSSSIEDALINGQPTLLIGDQALRMAKHCPSFMRRIDLGNLWYHYTGIPFVFALWILRRESYSRQKNQFVLLAKQLQSSHAQAFSNLSTLAKKLSSSAVLNQEELVHYWQTMSYGLTKSHLEGLRLYFTLCAKYGLLAEVPHIRFI